VHTHQLVGAAVGAVPCASEGQVRFASEGQARWHLKAKRV